MRSQCPLHVCSLLHLKQLAFLDKIWYEQFGIIYQST